MSTDAKVVGYCRACGKALDETSVRSAQGTIFCEEHLPRMTESVPTAPAVSAAESQYASPYTASPYTASPYTTKAPPPMPNPDVSPGVAFVLGFIPGVGAIYNGQYAKGLVHVIIIGLMISILDNNAAHGLEPLMGLLLAGFWMYMAFEAFHTAKKRQQGVAVDEFSSLIPMRGGASRFPVAPVVLIALGVIFLLDNLDILDLRRMLRYWPVGLIALGAYMLYLRMAPAPDSSKTSEGSR
ncbi:MAG TPA: DUF5668 domain-containing protein [Bryobacteraceae bacterium]|nr:DUF5668 domain-containing protein [Bryobacteraceae bacterium]